MLMPTSAEFVAICQAQLALLTQSVSLSLGAVYLAEEWRAGEDPRLTAIAAVPDLEAAREALQRLMMASQGSPPAAGLSPQLRAADVETDPSAIARISDPLTLQEERLLLPVSPVLSNRMANPPVSQAAAQVLAHQLVLPLIHNGIALGLLVTERIDRAWLESEQQQLEQVATTLALACVVDQRAQWAEQQHRQQLPQQQHQQEVMDNLIHQFRNPLTALKTFGKLLLKRLTPTDNNREIAASIVRESDRLQELLKQLESAIEPPEWVDLNLAGSNSSLQAIAPVLEETGISTIDGTPGGVLGHRALQLERCSIASILEPLLISARAIAQEKDQTLRANVPSEPAIVEVDASALREVLSNLIDNAIKYTPPSGRIQVQVELNVDHWVIRITDSGLGIPQDDLPRLFERHYRGVQAHTEIPGTGLGLAIARDLLHQMQGEIQVFSPPRSQDWIGNPRDVAPNQGTTVLVRLPIVPPDRCAATPA